MTKEEFNNLKENEVIYCNRNIKDGPQKNWEGKIIHKCSKDLIVIWNHKMGNKKYFTFNKDNLNELTFFVSLEEAMYRLKQYNYNFVLENILTIEYLSTKKLQNQLEFEF